MTEPFEPLLTTSDWNAEWIRLQDIRKRADDPAVWDERAKTFPVKHGSQTGYVKCFLERAALLSTDTILDMGCGTGALATPLAQEGHPVIACDFSQGMLDVMAADHAQLGVTGVQARLLSWSDDWEASGIAAKSVDVALASRSIATTDLKAALLKLDRVARRRVCITLPCAPSPKLDESLLKAAGLDHRLGRDFLYAFNILAGLGIAPEVSYIPSSRVEYFDSLDDAVDGYTRIVTQAVGDNASPDELEAIPHRLRAWLKDRLVEDENGVHLPEGRRITWAFIAWDTE